MSRKMNGAMGDVEITSTRVVRPSSPTPPEAKHFKLSLLDQLSTPLHGNMTFFYPHSHSSAAAAAGCDDFSSKSLSLQTSLSLTLSRFYPFAGRLLDTSSVLCSDDGASFVEAHCPLPLSSFLASPVFPSLDPFIPGATGTLLVVQFTSFPCGGTALSLSLSHKFADVATFLTLLRSWADTARGSPLPLLPRFLGASVLPPRDLPPMSASLAVPSHAEFSARRFVFSPVSIARLKARVPGGVSRVEAVLALIWKCAMSAHKSRSGRFRASAMFQAVNLRRRTDPPLPDTAVGNFIWPIMVAVELEEEAELETLVGKMREALREFKANKFKGEEALGTVMEDLKHRRDALKVKGLHVYKCTSWCRFPIIDAADFGWGNPTWHYSANKMVSNTVALMDTKSGDGVEALVTLDDQDLAFLDCDHELLTYASANPAIYTG